MGQGGSKEADLEEIKFSGVRITPEFIAQLNGVPMEKAETTLKNGGSQSQAVMKRPRTPDLADRDAAAMIARSERLQRALNRTQRVGDLLLERENEEMQKIDELAEELIHKEYEISSRPRPCQEEAAACLKCYEDSLAQEGDITTCASFVEAYASCARNAENII